MKLIKFFFVIICLGFQIQAVNPVKPPKDKYISYMREDDLASALAYSKQEKKPIIIYVNASNCVSSREFSRVVMGSDTVKRYLKKNFNCINANTLTKQGDEYAKKFGVMIVPAVILVGIDQSIWIKPDLEVNAYSAIREFQRFFSSIELMEMIRVHAKTHGISLNEARVEIGKSLAKLDYKRKTIQNGQEGIRRFNLDIGHLHTFGDAYLKEWEKLIGD